MPDISVQLEMRARRLGKVTTVAQFLTLGVALLGSRLTEPLAMTAAASGLCAVIDCASAPRCA